MRWLLGSILLAGILGVFGFLSIKRIPFNHYQKWIKGEGWNRYYEVQNFSPLLLASPKLEPVSDYKEPYEELWKIFPLANALIPLPVRHPLYQTFPIVEFNQYRPYPHAGISITSSGAREIIRFYTIPMSSFKDFSLGQELFKLPYVRNRLLKVPQEKLWQDIFSKPTNPKPETMEELFYNLYLIHLRSKLLPPGTIRYGLIKKGTQVLVQLESKDKDYKVEIVMHERSGNVYSYILRTAINNEESKKLRDKFLGTIDFAPSDPAVGRILHTEFKQLSFSRQVDQEGIQYLYSSWTQNMKSEEALKELIFYMERGRGNTQRLQPFYRYAIKKYGKTFTLRTEMEDSDDPEVALARKIELEDARQKVDLEKEKNRPAAVPDMTPDERMNLYLKKARENKKVNDKEMTIH